jgi:hypothetical protein
MGAFDQHVSSVPHGSRVPPRPDPVNPVRAGSIISGCDQFGGAFCDREHRAVVFLRVIAGTTDASATWSPSTPRTRISGIQGGVAPWSAVHVTLVTPRSGVVHDNGRAWSTLTS